MATGRHAWKPGVATGDVWFETLQDAAKEFYDYFELATRPNGDKFYRTKEGTPDWVVDIVHKAHGGMPPEDYRYEFVISAVEMLRDYDDPDDALSNIQPDVYTSDLLDWLRSRNDRTWYVDEAIRNFGKAENLEQDIMAGQVMEREEVFQSVRGDLEDMVT